MKVDRIRQRLDYDPASGILTWRDGPNAGLPAGGKNNGYHRVKIDGITIGAHRIAWALTYGYWPAMIDHIDRDRGNNRIENLREANHKVNGENRSMDKRNSSGTTGVYLLHGRWIARIGGGKNRIHLGTFESKADAIKARKDAEREMGYHPNHGR